MGAPLPSRLLAAAFLAAVPVADGAEGPPAPWDRVPPVAESLFHLEYPADAHEGEWRARFGGHARSMFEAYENPDFGFGGSSRDAWVHHRVEALLSLENREAFQFTAELTWGDMEGKNQPLAPVDEDRPDLLQAYAQARLASAEDWELDLRAGRQFLIYGSGRLLSHREGANQRLAHDALRLSWRRGPWRMDGFLASPVKIRPGAFDNRSRFDDTRLWGVYATNPSLFGAGNGVDLYYLGLRQEDAPLSPGESEARHTFGARWFGSGGEWEYNDEFILQTGESGERDILAGAVSLGLGRRFSALPLKPMPGLKLDAVSGGGSAGETHTFNPLFQANNYFNEGGFVSPSNLWNINPVLDLTLHRTVSLSMGVNFLWRFDADDAVYAPPFNAIVGAAPDRERYLGTAYNLSLGWNPHPSLDVSLGLTHHEAGPSITSLGGRSVDYLQLAVRVEF